MKEHLQWIRIQHARELLNDPRKSILDIAEEVGFSSPQQFQQLFRKITGMRPTDYRKQQEKK